MEKKFLVFINYSYTRELKTAEIKKETEKTYKLGGDNNSFRSLFYKDQPHRIVSQEQAEKLREESRRLYDNYRKGKRRRCLTSA